MKKRLLLVGFVIFGLMLSCSQEKDTTAKVEEAQNNETQKLFELVASDKSGVKFINKLPLDERINIFTYEYYYNGGGVAAGDINNDGLPDLYFTSNLGDNRLYLNKGGLTFEDITEVAKVGGASGWTTGVTMADVNADGFLDIYVCRSGRFNEEVRKNELYINNQDNTFTEEGEKYGLADPAYSTQALFFDLDHDNDLDVFLLNHSIELFSGKYVKQWKAKSDPLVGDKLFRNDGGKFVDITGTSGIHHNALGYGLGIAAGDLNSDGWTDIYVTNDYLEPDYMYINNQDGTFTESVKSATGHISNFGMGVDIADFNNDGLSDLVVMDMVAEDNYRQKTNMKSMNPEEFYQAVEYGFHYQYMFNSLQLNRGATKFSEIGQMAGVSNTDWSWTTLFSDLNNDGWKDLFITNGFRKEFGNKDFVNYRNQQTTAAMNAPREQRIKVVRDLLSKMKDGKTMNYVFENRQGMSYAKRSEDWGIDIPSFSNGGITVDLDNDGDMELVVNNIDQEAFIFQNKTSESLKTGYLKVKLKGPAGNPFGIGAKVTLQSKSHRQVQENYPTRGYQSSVEPVLGFGLGNDAINSLSVVWPDGQVEVLQGLEKNSLVEIDYANSILAHDKPTKESSTIFQDISQGSGVEFKHVENKYNDFRHETLLPHRMSQFGPALAVGDVNGDQLDDFYIGGAKGQEGQLYLQTGAGKFSKMKETPWTQDKYSEDVGAVFFDSDGDGDKDLYVVSGGNEFKQGQTQLNDRLYINNAGFFEKSKGLLPRVSSSGSVAVPGDFDGDGDLDLFVGGRLIPGKYPLPASSTLLENNQGKFTDVTSEKAPELRRIGMVTSAIWTDYDGNGTLDLMVTGEWMAIKILKNDGTFSLVQSDSLDAHIGWWYSLEQNDFDGDGDIDYVAGNLGLNYKYKASADEPFKVYADDFDKNGSLDIVLGYFNKGALFPLRGRQCSSEQMPFIKKKFTSYHDFGLATLNEVYGEKELEKSLHYSASDFASAYVENLGDGRFKFTPLPSLAQVSSVNGILIDDYDNDGHDDIVLAGNLYPVEVETIRNDASYGLFLRGSGDGTFESIDLQTSGLKIEGDVKQLRKIGLGNSKRAILAGLNDGIPVLVEVK